MHSLLEGNSDAICCLWEVWQVYVAQASLEVALGTVMHTLNVAIRLRFTYLHAGIASFPGEGKGCGCSSSCMWLITVEFCCLCIPFIYFCTLVPLIIDTNVTPSVDLS